MDTINIINWKTANQLIFCEIILMMVWCHIILWNYYDWITRSCVVIIIIILSKSRLLIYKIICWFFCVFLSRSICDICDIQNENHDYFSIKCIVYTFWYIYLFFPYVKNIDRISIVNLSCHNNSKYIYLIQPKHIFFLDSLCLSVVKRNLSKLVLNKRQYW